MTRGNVASGPDSPAGAPPGGDCRWVLERIYGWMQWHRLVYVYEQRFEVSQTMIHIAPGSYLCHRIV
jgi:hypothetical protein